MAKRVFLLSLITSLLAASPVFPFEINGFKSGMTRQQVKALAEKKYSKVEDEQQRLTAWNIARTGPVDSILFSFCEDKLVFVSSALDVDFSIKNIFLLTDMYLQTYGQPSRVVATSDILGRGLGESRTIVYVWRSGPEQHSLIFRYLENAAGAVNLVHQKAFVREGIARGHRPELVGGGLVRSLGGRAQVLSLRRKGSQVAADARVLGSGDFTERLRAEAARREKETLRLARHVVDLPSLGRKIAAGQGLGEADLRSGIRLRGVVRARRVFCKVAAREMGYSGAEVARFLGVTTSSVNRLAVSEPLPEVRRYLNAL